MELGRERRSFRCGISKKPSSYWSRCSTRFSPSLGVLTEHPTAGFLPVSESRQVVPEKNSLGKSNFVNDCLPRTRGRVKRPSGLLISKPKSKSYSSIGYSCPKSERNNLMSPLGKESNSSQLFSSMVLGPEAQYACKMHESNNYFGKSNLCLNLPKLRKVKSLPTVFRSASETEVSQDLQIEAKTALRSYEPLEARGQKVNEEDEGKNETMIDSDLQRVIKEILHTAYGLQSLKSGSEIHGGLTDISEIYTLLKLKGHLSHGTIRNELLKRGLVVSHEQLTMHLELLAKAKSAVNGRAR